MVLEKNLKNVAENNQKPKNLIRILGNLILSENIGHRLECPSSLCPPCPPPSGGHGGGHVFSLRRAKRMMFIEPILSGKIESEIMFEMESGNFAIFCEELECVIYLRNRVGSGGLQIGTFFDFGKDHTKTCLKQKKKCTKITLQEIKQIINTPCGEGADIFGPTTP